MLPPREGHIIVESIVHLFATFLKSHESEILTFLLGFCHNVLFQNESTTNG